MYAFCAVSCMHMRVYAWCRLCKRMTLFAHCDWNGHIHRTFIGQSICQSQEFVCLIAYARMIVCAFLRDLMNRPGVQCLSDVKRESMEHLHARSLRVLVLVLDVDFFKCLSDLQEESNEDLDAFLLSVPMLQVLTEREDRDTIAKELTVCFRMLLPCAQREVTGTSRQVACGGCSCAPSICIETEHRDTLVKNTLYHRTIVYCTWNVLILDTP